MNWQAIVKDRVTREDGSMSVAWLILLPGLILTAGIAIDISVLNYEKRVTQGQADLAALSAIRNLSLATHTRSIADETARHSDPFEILGLHQGDVIFGHMDETNGFVANPDQSTTRNTSAVAVWTATHARFPVLRALMGNEAVEVRRRAIAKAEPRVSFALSNCLMSFNLFNDMLRPIVALDGDLLCSGHGLRIDTFELLDRVALSAVALQPGEATYGDVLDAEVFASDVIAAALGRPVAHVSDRLRLSDILYVGEDLRNLAVGSPVEDIPINVADVVFGSAEILGARIVDLEMTADLGPVANAPVRLVISDPRQIVVGATPGDPEARASTSQIRLAVDGLDLLGLVRVSLSIDVAKATARLSREGEHCNKQQNYRAAVFDPAKASLINVAVEVDVLGSLLGDLLSVDLDLASVEEVVSFTHRDVERQHVKWFEPPVGGLVDDLGDELADEIADVPLAGGLLSGLLSGVTAPLLAPVAGLVEQIAGDLLDLGIAEAKLEVLDVSCTVKLAG